MKIFALTIFSAALLVSAANAATVDINAVAPSNPGPEAVAAGAPDGASVSDFRVTTDADILSIGKVLIEVNGSELYNVAPPFGSNTAAPDPAFVNLNRALEADSFITTPGVTSLLGADFPGDGASTWGDLSDDGAVNDFLFARLTLPAGVQGTFSGQVTVAGSAGPENFTFSYPIGVPEPTSIMLAGLGLIGFVAKRRRS